MKTGRLPHLRTVIALLVLMGCSEKKITEPTRALFDFDGPNRLAIGDMASCALDASGQTWCWGDNQLFGGRGLGQTGYRVSQLPALSPISPLAALSTGGSQHRCGVAPDGTGICWGR